MNKKYIITIFTLLFITSATAVEGFNGNEGDMNIMSNSPNNISVEDPSFVPGDMLYGVERLSDSLRIAAASAPVIGSPAEEAKVRMQVANKRLAEAVKISERGGEAKAAKLVSEYSKNAERASGIAKQLNDSGVNKTVSKGLAVAQKQLETVSERTPEEASEGLNQALNRIEENTKNFADDVGNVNRGR